ncbi:MAG TPA: MBL fold metallo-hydrolase [Thermomicrobiales bacterium]|jgi:L-ascorbate metabolism protein UlaG (beta-lactamase superfamily)|nr:MBL fold metallo-hydrolase [Thermomicrobiales bacterium]
MAEIRWFGHNCFRIKSREATVLMDPVGKKTGYTPSKQTADIVTVSHEHPGHNNAAMVKPEYALINGPGEYELNNIFVTGIRTYHDKVKGAERGYNTIYELEMEGMRIAHLGDLGHVPDEQSLERIEAIDILFVPAGGGPLLSPSEMAELVGTISPKMVIPMQFQTRKGDKGREPVDAFCKHLGIEIPPAVDKLTVKTSDLSDQMQLVVMEPVS